MALLAFSFIAIPAVELALLIEVGSRIGTFQTFLLIVATGIAGAALARSQGLGVLARIQRELEEGRPPATALVDAAIVLVSAVLLLTPGLLTDLVGLAGLIPPIRAGLRRLAWRYLERAIADRRIEFRTFSQGTGFSAGPEFESRSGFPSRSGFRSQAGFDFGAGETVEPEYRSHPDPDPAEATPADALHRHREPLDAPETDAPSTDSAGGGGSGPRCSHEAKDERVASDRTHRAVPRRSGGSRSALD